MSTTDPVPGSANGRPPVRETLTVPTRRGPAEPAAEPADRSPAFLPVIPGFRVVRWLGGGGMGDVYEVVDEVLGVTFALKTVRPDRTHVAYAERFRQEVRAMAGLDHPNIARYYARGDIDGWPYFTMKFIRGGTLADRRAAYRADPRAAVALLVKVTDAVQYLHARGLVHRDLKPSNILLDEGGEPCLSDFGLVKDVGDPPDAVDGRRSASAETVGPPAFVDTQTLVPPPADAPTLTRTGGVIGTYAYMSPEQARGDKRRIGPATDIWALGVILYERLSGHRPDQESDTDTAPADLESPTRAAGRVPVGADPELARIVARCLVEDVGQRYPTAGQLAADLRRWLG